MMLGLGAVVASHVANGRFQRKCGVLYGERERDLNANLHKQMQVAHMVRVLRNSRLVLVASD